MDSAKFVILGGGMVAGYAAQKMAELGLKSGELEILSADSAVPYERPPLSKGYLAGRDTADSVRINQPDFYRNHGIEVRLNTRVQSLDPKRKVLTLAGGSEFGFDHLVIATGANPRTLDVPGAHLGNVYYLRSLEDSSRIRDAAAKAKRAAVVGSGFIGMEVASVLAQKNVETTMVIREDRIWKNFFTPEMSKFFESYYTARGVQFRKNVSISSLRGDGAVNSLALANGEIIACDLVVAGIGVTPVTSFLEDSGLQIDNGIQVNEFLETGRPGIYAAGDVANYPDLLFKKRRRVEHWDNAVSQGQHCARTLMGTREAFRHVPYFFSDVFDLSYEFWGDPAIADQTVTRGDLTTNSFSVWWLQNKKVVAAFVMNRPDEEREQAPKLIENGQELPFK